MLLSIELKCNDSITNLEIGIFSKIPWHVIGIFPDDIVFIESKRCAGVDKATNGKVSDIGPGKKSRRRGPIKCKKVTHCSNGEIRHDVHPVSVDCIDGILPFRNIAHMRVQNAEVKWGVHYRGLAALIIKLV